MNVLYRIRHCVVSPCQTKENKGGKPLYTQCVGRLCSLEKEGVLAYTTYVYLLDGSF